MLSYQLSQKILGVFTDTAILERSLFCSFAQVTIIVREVLVQAEELSVDEFSSIRLKGPLCHAFGRRLVGLGLCCRSSHSGSFLLSVVL
jgi:hypothetical protein